VHLTRLGERRPDTSSGYLVEGAQLQVTDPATGQSLPVGQRGELWIRGRGLMAGYFHDPEATAAVMRPGGWYASGDLGELHPDGALFVVGRLKEMIIRSGFNVYPAEVELALNALPGVQRSAVVGRPESDGNEEVIAFVELRPGATLDEPAARQRLREKLAPYKLPAHIITVPELPTSHNGKVLKRQLQQQALGV
jgi:acyl-CoA synthetase (AMP-forming)/AMP-acid ligase II